MRICLVCVSYIDHVCSAGLVAGMLVRFLSFLTTPEKKNKAQTENGSWLNRRRQSQTVFPYIIRHFLKTNLCLQMQGMWVFFLCKASMLLFPFFVVIVCPCESLCLWWLIRRASEQKHISVTEHLNGSFAQQLDLDLYLGVYAGEAHWVHIAFCVLSRLWIRAAIQWTDPQFFGCGPRPSRPNVCVHGLSCTAR